MKSDDGRVLIEGFYDDVVPLGNTEKKALEEMRTMTRNLEKRTQFAKPRAVANRLFELLQLPSLNIRGLRSGLRGRAGADRAGEPRPASMCVWS